MALLDYGAVLKVNGKIIADNMFIETSNLEDKNKKIHAFAIVRNKDLSITFFKLTCEVFINGILYKTIYMNDCSSKRVVFGNLDIHLTHIDQHYTFGELSRRIDNKRVRKKYDIHYASVKSKRSTRFKRRTLKYYAEWWYDGKHYEVVYGYGIDPSKEIYDDIKHHHFEYTAKEIEFIDKFFEENLESKKQND